MVRAKKSSGHMCVVRRRRIRCCGRMNCVSFLSSHSLSRWCIHPSPMRPPYWTMSVGVMPGFRGAPVAHHVLIERRQAHAVLDAGDAVHDLREVHLRVSARLRQDVEPELARGHHRQVAALARRLRVVLDGDRAVILIPPQLFARAGQRFEWAVHPDPTRTAAVDRRPGREQPRARELPRHQHVGHPAVPELVAVDLHHGGDAVRQRAVEIRRVLFDDVEGRVIDVRMRMRIHESGNDGVSGEIEDPRVCRDLNIATDRLDPVPPDEHGGVLQDSALRVHGDHPDARERHGRVRFVDRHTVARGQFAWRLNQARGVHATVAARRPARRQSDRSVHPLSRSRRHPSRRNAAARVHPSVRPSRDQLKYPPSSASTRSVSPCLSNALTEIGRPAV